MCDERRIVEPNPQVPRLTSMINVLDLRHSNSPTYRDVYSKPRGFLATAGSPQSSAVFPSEYSSFVSSSTRFGRGYSEPSGTGIHRSLQRVTVIDRLRRLRPVTIRRLIAFMVFLSAVGLTVYEALTPRNGYTRVVVSSRALTAGATLSSQDVTTVDIPRELVPSAVVTDPAAARGRSLALGMAQGEILTEQRMVGPELAQSLTGAGDSKIVAITLSDTGIVPALRSGDSVDIVSTTGDGRAAQPLAHGARVVNISDGEVVLVALPSGAAELVAATALTSPVTLLLAG